jgi:hypothetical protein
VDEKEAELSVPVYPKAESSVLIPGLNRCDVQGFCCPTFFSDPNPSTSHFRLVFTPLM